MFYISQLYKHTHSTCVCLINLSSTSTATAFELLHLYLLFSGGFEIDSENISSDTTDPCPQEMSYDDTRSHRDTGIVTI
jgi:hypothetical protein